MQNKKHTCGYPIAIEWRHNGLSYYVVFYDDNTDSPTAGDRVSMCPGCGETILSTDFIEKKDVRDND